VPLVLTHGWPSSVLEFSAVLPLLTEPGAAGVPGFGFSVVVPSLPGTGWSGLPPEGPVEPARIAGLWAGLMTALGYERFGAAGGDIGAGVTNFLGANHPERVIGVHTHHPPLHPVLDPAEPLDDEEQAYLEARAQQPGPDAGYVALQQTRPDTLAAGLSDSPAGLAAWILEKYHDWGDLGDDDLFTLFPPDTLAGILSLYWFTNSIGTSFRPYVDDEATPPLPPVTVPAAVSLTPEDAAYPRRFAERTYRDLRQWRGPDRGGHFLALERPARLARDLADFFAPLA
jgi:pimeloyl-ACP methyl ester carboxylesterase